MSFYCGPSTCYILTTLLATRIENKEGTKIEIVREKQADKSYAEGKTATDQREIKEKKGRNREGERMR